MTATRNQTTFGRAGTGAGVRRPAAASGVIADASSFGFYWPYYIGVGGPGVIYLAILAFAISAQLQVNPIIAAVTLLIGTPFLMAGFLATAFLITKMLAGIRGAAGGIGAMRQFALANPGGQLGLVAGLAIFAFRQKEQLDALFSGGAGAEAPSMLLITMFAHAGVGALLGDIAYKKIHKTGEAAPKPAPMRAPKLPATLMAFIERWPFFLAGACAGLAFLGAMLAPVISEASTFSVSGFAIDAIFCVVAFFVLRLYFSILKKILSGAHWLFGKVGELM